MTKTEAKTALQRFYDYDRLEGYQFTKRHCPAVHDDCRKFWEALDCPEYAKDPGEYLDTFLADRARDALKVLGVVQ